MASIVEWTETQKLNQKSPCVTYLFRGEVEVIELNVLVD